MFTLLSSVYRKRIIGKQARGGWSIGVIGAVALLATVGPIESDAAGLGQTREYGACMRLARVSPTEGFETALAWSDAGGGGAAKHCAAVALFSMGQYAEAAIRFEDLAEELRANTSLRAELLAQAGQAWHQAGEIDRAYTTHSLALEAAPSDPNIRIDRAMVLAERGQYELAIEDLDAALAANPSTVQALILRASAYRHIDRLDEALRDAVRAIELSPNYPEAYLERGNIRRLLNDIEGARQDWLALLTRFEGTPAADAAQRNIEELDLRTE